MSDTLVLIFSKQRTLQLRSLLLSLFELSDVAQSQVHVLYTTNPEIDYQPLIEEFSGCHFKRQSVFYDDLRAILRDHPQRHVLFMVDDLICRAPFSIAAIERFLEAHGEVDCFSLRLGRHIEDGTPPDFRTHPEEMLSWSTASGLGRTWNYFWEVSSSVYRTTLVQAYLARGSKELLSFPNPLESRYYCWFPTFLGGWRNWIWRLFRRRARVQTMACFERSICFTQGVNLVAARDKLDQALHTPEALHQQMLEGYRIDYASLREVRNVKPNAGSQHFKLIR